MSYTEPSNIKELRKESKDVRAVLGSLYRASVDQPTTVPQQQEQSMLTIKSRQIRNQIYTIADQHVSFDVHGIGHIPACYRFQVEKFISRNQGFFTIVEEEKISEPVAPTLVEVVAPVKAEPVIPVLTYEEPEINLEEEDQNDDDSYELTEEQKQFLAVVEQSVEPMKEPKTKPTVTMKRGRPTKKK